MNSDNSAVFMPSSIRSCRGEEAELARGQGGRKWVLKYFVSVYPLSHLFNPQIKAKRKILQGGGAQGAFKRGIEWHFYQSVVDVHVAVVEADERSLVLNVIVAVRSQCRGLGSQRRAQYPAIKPPPSRQLTLADGYWGLDPSPGRGVHNLVNVYCSRSKFDRGENVVQIRRQLCELSRTQTNER